MALKFQQIPTLYKSMHRKRNLTQNQTPASNEQFPLPSDISIQKIAASLEKQIKEKAMLSGTHLSKKYYHSLEKALLSQASY